MNWLYLFSVLFRDEKYKQKENHFNQISFAHRSIPNPTTIVWSLKVKLT
jgi:hypothetical protein